MTPTRSRRLLLLPAAAVLALSAAGLAQASTAPPGSEPPATMAPATDAPGTMAPGSVAPGSEAPGSMAPSSEAPSSAAPGTSGGGGSSGAAASTDLSGVCPATISIQTDWNPEAEHGWLYQLIGDDPVIDAEAGTVTGPLVASGVDTGVQVQVRSGGPFIGYQTVTSQMYNDDSITLGFVYTDEGIQNAAQFPTVAVYSGMEKNPQMIMWDPATYPDVHTIADLGTAGVLVRYFGGAAYMDYFTQTGILSPDHVDGSYDGTPAAFVASGGKDAQQGFGSAEPYIYEHEVADWMKPVAYQYINDAGWQNYGQSIAVRADQLDGMHDCLTKLVPIIQQATIDYLADPAETNQLILDAVAAINNGWVYTPGVADYAVQTMINDGLIANGTDGVLGSFDADRVNNLIDIGRPVYAALGQEPPADLTADDVVTNEFLDPSISLSAASASPATAAAGTEAAGTEAAGTEATGTEAAGTTPAGTESMGTVSTDTGSMDTVTPASS